MPDVLVETRGGWLEAKRAAFLEAIQVAMVKALRIPPHDKVLRLMDESRLKYRMRGRLACFATLR